MHPLKRVTRWLNLVGKTGSLRGARHVQENGRIEAQMAIWQHKDRALSYLEEKLQRRDLTSRYRLILAHAAELVRRNEV